jgi:hypothetical protein
MPVVRRFITIARQPVPVRQRSIRVGVTRAGREGLTRDARISGRKSGFSRRGDVKNISNQGFSKMPRNDWMLPEL